MKKNFLLLFFAWVSYTSLAQVSSNSYSQLLELTDDLRKLERTSLPNGVPDYRPTTIIKIQSKLLEYKNKWAKIDTLGWGIEQKVDYVLLKAEMNALDFNCRILKPWVRDPSFYAIIFADQSDTPDHEGPTSFAAIELWKYTFPLNPQEEEKLISQLNVITPLFQQAKGNLTGNAKDLWIAGTSDVKGQLDLLNLLSEKTTSSSLTLKEAIENAKVATKSFVAWLENQQAKKNGPSGIGKENYTWHLKNVLLVPFSWEEEVTLLNRELTRAHSSLLLEKERNKNLPELKAFSTEKEFILGTDKSVKQMMAFIEQKEILPVKPYMETELRKHLGSFVPEDERNFFGNISFREPNVLYAHLIHWFEIGRLRENPHPSPLRKEALPYNLWMQRSEGLATAFEETLMHAGLWDDNPRARELVWIMLAQRCARGLASLYAHANQINFEQARKFQVEWTPKGWTGDESLVGFEQHLYLRQPGYGTSYVTGKYFFERLLMDVGRKEGNDFKLYNFFESFFEAAPIPNSLVRWQMTGSEDEIKSLFRN